MKLTKSDYEKRVLKFFIEFKSYIENQARKIKNIHFSIPLEIDDMLIYSYSKLLEPENKIRYYELKNEDKNIDEFFKRKVVSFMWIYCNIYKSKNHQILNKSILFSERDDEVEGFVEENYKYEELFNFLTSEEFFVVYEIYVNKLKRKHVAKIMNISIFKLKNIENEARNKINKHYNLYF